MEVRGNKLKRARVFVAVPVPEKVRERIERLQEKLEKKLKWPVRWEPIEKIHLTLVFLGSIDLAKQGQLLAVLADLNQELNSTTGGDCGQKNEWREGWQLKIGELGWWRKKRADTIIYLEVSELVLPGREAGWLRKLHRKLVKRLNSLDFCVSRRFDAHLTIGRIKRRHESQVGDLSRLAEFGTGRLGIGRLGMFPVRLELWRSMFDKKLNTTEYFVVTPGMAFIHRFGVSH